MAIFGQMEFDLSDDMELAFAARYDREERDVHNTVPAVGASGLSANAGFAPINPAFNASFDAIPDRSATFSQFQPKVTWSWNGRKDKRNWKGYCSHFADPPYTKMVMQR